MLYVSADDILAEGSNAAGPSGGFDASKITINAGGWPCEGPGIGEGSGVHLRTAFDDVLVVMFATMANRSLTERFDSSEQTFMSMAGLRRLRQKYDRITYPALRERV